MVWVSDTLLGQETLKLLQMKGRRQVEKDPKPELQAGAEHGSLPQVFLHGFSSVFVC